MILTDREIRIALRDKIIIIDPKPDLAVTLTSTAIDLTLSDTFSEWRSLGATTISPGESDFKYSELANNLHTTLTGPYVLRPHSFILGWTAERVDIPYTSRLAARVEGKSSLARLGISIHFTALYSTRNV